MTFEKEFKDRIRDEYEILSYLNRERESTYDFSLIRYGRRVGNTTRFADKGVQIVLSGKVCIVTDHYRGEGGTRIHQDKRLFDIIMRRLISEHQLGIDIVVANTSKLEIYLTQKYLDVIRNKK